MTTLLIIKIKKIIEFLVLPKGVGYEYHLKTALESALFELMVSGGSINDKILVTGCPKSMLFSPKVQWNKSYC